MAQQSKILIIDDEEVVLDSCTQILQGGPFSVTTAPDGMTGLRLVEEMQPDLIFVDLKMPGISGLEVLDKVQEIDQTIVTVVITGFATVDSAVEAMKKGAYDFLPKPFTPDEFRLITRRGIERRKLMLETIALRREKELLREQFASIVSHELKSPLSAVQQNLFALEFELSGVLNTAQKEKLARIKSRMEDLLKLISSWLRAISVDTRKLRESFTLVSVKDALARAVENVETFAQRKDIRIVSAAGGPEDLVLGDMLSLSEALVNILNNAVKYSYNGQEITVKIGEAGDDVLISIQDHGIGIGAEDLPHIFEGFYRGKAGEEMAAGHGIGLAVCRQIVEAHGGSIEVESDPGQGTTFSIRLPRLHVVQPSPG